jgi:hypothetical protein
MLRIPLQVLPSQAPARHDGLRMRLAEGILVAALALGSLAMWLGIPVGWLWLLSRTSTRYLTIYGVALVACPPTMAAWGWCLHRINRLYLKLRETPGYRSTLARPEKVLEVFMTVSVVLAVATLIAWAIFFGAPGNGAAPGAW